MKRAILFIILWMLLVVLFVLGSLFLILYFRSLSSEYSRAQLDGVQKVVAAGAFHGLSRL